ncbi:helix-turn-helix protein [Diaminobutyricimonas aerilata]|uniref:Helix-turn-helix protein n=1 Tax=Diaminobutyricimonas aerilata TaxID=1162967 RepID=A0A2M9CG40_9MICO|nr:metalloregulator ArsR/SmtB family transcription factor [Diaminobutyricimonas aerilata]PJJ70901.1 helix-turn-helix protein [Diaminobutyricimonas aerilata]
MPDIFDVIADATRRDILAALLESRSGGDTAAGELSVGQLVERLSISQPTVSKHLKVLRDHGLVTVRDAAQHRYYRVDGAPLVEIESWIAPFIDAELDPADSDDTAVFAAWAGTDVADRVGRAAAETAHRASAPLRAVKHLVDRTGRR